jgi:hypothetical protein
MEPASREALQERQRRWMAQRQAELDRRAAQESVQLNSTSGAGAVPFGPTASSSEPSCSACDNSAVLDRLTEQITERLQVEVRRENARLMQDGAVGAQVKSLLERHIGTNTCPICYELMSGKAHQPMLLFPCGHTFCAECLHQHLEKLKRQTCPYCREKVASRAPNISLQQVIDGFVEKQQALDRGEVLSELVDGQDLAAAAQRRPQPPQQYLPPAAGAGRLSDDEEASRYAEQYRAFSMRCRVMANQLSDSRSERGALNERRQTASAVLGHLERDEAAAAERLEAARLELEVIRSQLAEQREKCEQVERDRTELVQMEGIVQQTHASLEAERQKTLLLVRNFAPALAESLAREFG